MDSRSPGDLVLRLPFRCVLPVVGVTVKRTFKDGTLLDRDTLFVYEDGTWLHRFTKEKNKGFMPDASNEEFVAAHR